MKTNYFTKVENKYVFNISRIFWHIFIIVGTIAVVFSLWIYMYGLIPPSKKTVEKSPLPTKQAYPSVIIVSLDDLKLIEEKTEIKAIIEPSKKEIWITGF